MAYSYTVAETESFTVTHAPHIAAKVATDLKRMQRFYGSPSDAGIAEYQAEIIEFLKEDYLGTLSYGFKRNGDWIEPTLRYIAKDLAGAAANDDDPGKVRPGSWLTRLPYHIVSPSYRIGTTSTSRPEPLNDTVTLSNGVLASVLRRPPLVVLAGDVGAGKSELAETIGDAVARQERIDITLFPMSLSTRGQGRVGEMTQLLSTAFEYTVAEASKLKSASGKARGAVLLLVDEADALAQSRKLRKCTMRTAPA